MRQYEMAELCFQGPKTEKDWVSVDLKAEIRHADSGETAIVMGFYAGGGNYKIRFLPKHAGAYTVQVSGIVNKTLELNVEKADPGCHGIVRTEGTAFVYEDGTPFHPFGTTVYALISQTDELIEQTMQTLEKAPFNKIRMCVFPKDYDFNHNEPSFYAFEEEEVDEADQIEDTAGAADAVGQAKNTAGAAADTEKTAEKKRKWDPSHPVFPFWDALDRHIARLGRMGIQVDLILFHPYDRWGFDGMGLEKDKTYLDYLIRRLAAFPNVWWSLANEYELCSRSREDWDEIEHFVAERDPYHHLLSCHNIFEIWDAQRPLTTHASIQSKCFWRLNEWREKFRKPVILDECCYEGNIEPFWGSVTRSPVVRSWRIPDACRWVEN